MVLVYLCWGCIDLFAMFSSSGGCTNSCIDDKNRRSFKGIHSRIFLSHFQLTINGLNLKLWINKVAKLKHLPPTIENNGKCNWFFVGPMGKRCHHLPVKVWCRLGLLNLPMRKISRFLPAILTSCCYRIA